MSQDFYDRERIKSVNLNSLIPEFSKKLEMNGIRAISWKSISFPFPRVVIII